MTFAGGNRLPEQVFVTGFASGFSSTGFAPPYLVSRAYVRPIRAHAIALPRLLTAAAAIHAVARPPRGFHSAVRNRVVPYRHAVPSRLPYSGFLVPGGTCNNAGGTPAAYGST